MLAWGLRFLIAIELCLYTVLARRLLGVDYAAAISLAGLGVLLVRTLPCALTFILSAGGQPSLSWGRRLSLWLGEYAAFVANFVFLSPAECLWMQPARLAPMRSGTPLVLVHGYSCSRAAWWWQRRRLEAAGFTVATLSLEPIYADIETYLPALSERIDAVLTKTGARQVALVGHSMGGLVIRAWLARHGGERVSRVVTLGTPHGGTRLARLGLGRNARQMELGSAWLQSLGETAVDRVAIFSAHDNYVAPRSQLEWPGARRVELVGLGHLAMLFSARVAAEMTEALGDLRSLEAMAQLSSVRELGALTRD